MASTMELMRELKHLTELHRQGQLGGDGAARLTAIRAVLDQQMQGRSASPARPQRAHPHTAPTPATPAAAAPGQEPSANPQALDVPPELAAQVETAAERADAAMRASNPRPRPTTTAEMVEQLAEVNRMNVYTRSEAPPQFAEYFAYAEHIPVPEAPVDFPVIDPRAAEHLQGAGSTDSTWSAVSAMPGGVFLDDFAELYTSGIVSAEEMDAGSSNEAPDPNLLIAGKRKVTVHMATGEVKRGVIARLARQDGAFTLLPQGAGRPEGVAMAQVKAIFVSLGVGTLPPAPRGKPLTVTFRDGRQIQGASPDFGLGPTFTLIPMQRGAWEVIIVSAAQVRDAG
jgi:hypothetical protein